MLASLTSFALSYFLGVALWYVLRLYFLKRRITINTYYTFIAAIFSVMCITLTLRFLNLDKDGWVIGGIVVMGLFSLDSNPNADPNARKKAMVFMLIGSICAGILNTLLSQI